MGWALLCGDQAANASNCRVVGAEVEERDWIMMAVINIGAILEYGRPDAVLHRIGSKDSAHSSTASPLMANAGKVKLMMARKADAERMDIDDDARAAPSPMLNPAQAAPTMAEADEPELPIALQHALQLTFTMLTHTLARPVRERPFRRGASVNPYISVLLTFLATVLQDRKDRTTERVLARAVPWEALARFLTTLSRRVMARELHRESNNAAGLLSAATQPLPEDWCLRGLIWGGRKIYERGFWDRGTSGEEKNMEAGVLDRVEASEEGMDGIIEDEDEDETGKPAQAPARDGPPELMGRFVRIARAGLKIGKMVNGFSYVPPAARDGRGEWRVEGVLADKVVRWKEEARREREEEARRLRGTRWVDDDDSMDVDDDEGGAALDESSEDEDVASEEVKELKVCAPLYGLFARSLTRVRFRLVASTFRAFWHRLKFRGRLPHADAPADPRCARQPRRCALCQGTPSWSSTRTSFCRRWRCSPRLSRACSGRSYCRCR